MMRQLLPLPLVKWPQQHRYFSCFAPSATRLQQNNSERKRRRGSQQLPGTVTYTVSPLRSGGSGATHGFQSKSAEAIAALPALRCPGGPRLKAEGLKHLYKVPHAGFLAKYDQRFMLNLKLTHQVASHLSRTTLKTDDKVLLELGPGAGSLTRSLLTRPCHGVLGVEKDERFNAHLEQIRSYTRGKFQWVNADVLTMNELQLLQQYFPKFARQHQRHRPGSAEKGKAGGGDGNDEESTNSHPHGDESSGTYEGAPLRSAQRERLLRQRQARYTAAAGGGGDGGRPSSSSAPHRRNVTFDKHSYSNDSRNRNSSHQHHPSSNAALDLTEHWWADGEAKVEVVANLPFSIITELIMRYAVDCSRRTNLFSFGRVPLHIFAQKEVADRMVAPAGSLHFSRLSVLTQAFFHVSVDQVFTEWTYYPKTEVLGALLTLEPRVVPLGWAADSFSSSHMHNSNRTHAVVDGAVLIHFTDLIMKAGQRGSSVHKSLSSFMPAEVVQYILQASRMDGAMTVLDLSVEELVRMAGMWRAFLTMSQQQQQQQQQ